MGPGIAGWGTDALARAAEETTDFGPSAVTVREQLRGWAGAQAGGRAVERGAPRPAGGPRRIDPGHKVRRHERPTVEVALALLAAHLDQQPRLLGLLDALRDQRQVECLAHGDDRLGDGHVVPVGGGAADERLVDLELVDRQPLEIAQGRIASAEIIDGELNAHFAELAQDLQRVLGRPHDGVFGPNRQFFALRQGACFTPFIYHYKSDTY